MPMLDDDAINNLINSSCVVGRDLERDRCIAILHRARFGEIDTDLRSLISRIKSGEPAEAD